ncbi:cell wall-binding repeat-containing protein [Clostridium scatologenes]|uniref:Putative cell wall binding repeat 2-containing protein n=1 Tax=Clostridium scatologenes TaxID=1548 RepID=A0A0E3JQF4_CLOSL|nr:cell wall-binding repeat-containing protein [Clostridium scatologenes]AKA70848.1 putative cell wall binding repeat 2-containing protein [Clostridium scatologenes]
MKLNKINKTTTLASSSLIALVLSTIISTSNVSAVSGQASRTSGLDRYQTASQIATKNWTTSDNVVLVSGEGYADAVSASALAKKLDAPILLTSAKSLDTNTKQALATLKPKNIYIIGGNASVSKEVRDDLKTSYTLIELGGSNRYETNAKVAEKLVDLGVNASNVIMVGGEGFSDALSVAPVAAAKGEILLLGMNDTNYIKSITDFINKNNSKVTVVGTSYVINEATFTAVKANERIDGGLDRFDTNLKVLNSFKEDLKMDKAYIANASGDGYADALVASALAGKYASPLVLVDKESSSATTNAIDYLKTNIKASTDIQVIGGAGVVSDDLISKINAVIPTTPTTDETMPKAEIMEFDSSLLPFTTLVMLKLDTTTPEQYNVSVNGTNAQLTVRNDGTKVFTAALFDTYTQDQIKITVTKK